jgi:hypothetical protein
MALAAWRIQDGLPARMATGSIELEKHLEDWIERDIALIDASLQVLRRQMHVEGGILDLLCVDLQGRLTVIEIKRGKLIRETIAQAVDYASSISAMSEDALLEEAFKTLPSAAHDHPGVGALANSVSPPGERDVSLIVVGVGREPGLDRMIDYLGSRFGVPIRAVTFDVFETGAGEKVLVREETEPEGEVGPLKSASSVASVVQNAGGPDSANGRRLLLLANAAESAGLHVRPYKYSLMFSPPSKKTRYLITAWKWADKDELAISYSASALAEFFPVTEQQVQQVIGVPEGRHGIRSDEDAHLWASRIGRLFASISDGPATATSE